jgi:signal transduction histidine kinase
MSTSQRFKKFSFILSIAVTLVGFLVLIGWIFNLTIFKSIEPNWISMKANAAICFLFSGIILIAVNTKKPSAIARWSAIVLSAIVFIIGTITLLEYAFTFNAGVDELFFKDEGNAIAKIPAGRQSLFSAAYFVIFGFCYLPGTNKLTKTSLFQILHVVSGIFVLASAMSYVLGTYVIGGISLKFIHVIHSTIAFIFLIFAVLFSQPHIGVMKLAASNTNGGKTIRNTMPLFIIIFIVIGWLRQKGVDAGLYNEELGISAFIILIIIIMGYLLFSGAATFIKSEIILKQSEEFLNRAEKMGNLGHGYFDLENNKMHLSAGLYKIFGVVPEKFLHTIEGLRAVIHPGDNLIKAKAIDTLLTDGNIEVEFRILRPDGDVRNVFFKTVLTKNNKGEYANAFTTALDITESKIASEQIKLYNLQLRHLAGNLQNIREEERQRISREIHDELGQWLTALKMEIAGIKKIKGDEVRLNESMNEMLIQVDECIKSSRRISTELRPALIDDLGLIAALEWQAEEFEKRSKIKSEFITDIDELNLPPDFTIGIFRIFQESLTNVARHAQATCVKSSLLINKQEIILKISDNGNGFDVSTIGKGKTLGLIGMKERTLLMNGTYNITSSVTNGTEITVIIPYLQNSITK